MENTIVEINTSIEAAEWTAERDALIAEAQTVLQVASDAEFETAGVVQAKGLKLIKKLEAARKAVTSPIDDLKKSIMAKEKELRKDIDAEVNRIKSLTTAYATEQARKAAEEQRRIAEAERAAAEAAAAAEAERAAADPLGVFSASAEPPAPVVPTPIPTTHIPKSSATRVVERWDFEVVDPTRVPRQFLSVDETKIRTFLAAKKAEGYAADQIVIEGIKISSAMQVYSR